MMHCEMCRAHTLTTNCDSPEKGRQRASMKSKMSGKIKLTISRTQSTSIRKPGLKVCTTENFSISQLGKKNFLFFSLFVKWQKEVTEKNLYLSLLLFWIWIQMYFARALSLIPGWFLLNQQITETLAQTESSIILILSTFWLNLQHIRTFKECCLYLSSHNFHTKHGQISVIVLLRETRVPVVPEISDVLCWCFLHICCKDQSCRRWSFCLFFRGVRYHKDSRDEIGAK